MKILFRIIAIVLFVVFFGFALKNTQDVSLQFFMGYQISGPLVLLLLGFFVGGGVLGVLAMLPAFFRQRRELGRHRKTIAALQKENQAQAPARTQSPQPDAVINM